MAFDPLAVSIDDYADQYVQALDSCGGGVQDFTGDFPTWWTGDTAIATANRNSIHGVAAGTTNHYAESDPMYWGIRKAFNICPVSRPQTTAGTKVAPTIEGPNTVWWFNGQTPSGYSTSITLTASGGSTYSWNITSGSSMITLSGTTGSSVTVRSTGTAFSSTATSIAVTVTADGVSSAPFYITSRRPYTLVVGTITDQCDATWGYDDFFNYTIKDQMGTALPSSIPLNEYWTTAVVNDYPNTNWRRGNPGNYTTPSTSPAQFADEIQGENITLPPTPPTACPGAGQAVDHWGQEWFVGSLTSGSGSAVQTDTIQKYTNNAEIQGIASPVP